MVQLKRKHRNIRPATISQPNQANEFKIGFVSTFVMHFKRKCHSKFNFPCFVLVRMCERGKTIWQKKFEKKLSKVDMWTALKWIERRQLVWQAYYRLVAEWATMKLLHTTVSFSQRDDVTTEGVQRVDVFGSFPFFLFFAESLACVSLIDNFVPITNTNIAFRNLSIISRWTFSGSSAKLFCNKVVVDCQLQEECVESSVGGRSKWIETVTSYFIQPPIQRHPLNASPTGTELVLRTQRK